MTNWRSREFNKQFLEMVEIIDKIKDPVERYAVFAQTFGVFALAIMVRKQELEEAGL
jgi:hypothetical protein